MVQLGRAVDHAGKCDEDGRGVRDGLRSGGGEERAEAAPADDDPGFLPRCRRPRLPHPAPAASCAGLRRLPRRLRGLLRGDERAHAAAWGGACPLRADARIRPAGLAVHGGLLARRDAVLREGRRRRLVGRQDVDDVRRLPLPALQRAEDAEDAAPRRAAPERALLPHPLQRDPLPALGGRARQGAYVLRLHRTAARGGRRCEELGLHVVRLPRAVRRRRARHPACLLRRPHASPPPRRRARPRRRPVRPHLPLAHPPHRLHGDGQALRARDAAGPRMRQALEEGAGRALAAHAAAPAGGARREGRRHDLDHRQLRGRRPELDGRP